MAVRIRPADHHAGGGEPLPPARSALPAGDVQDGVLEAARAAEPVAALRTGIPDPLRAPARHRGHGVRRIEQRRRADGRPPGRAGRHRRNGRLRRFPATGSLDLPLDDRKLEHRPPSLLSPELRRPRRLWLPGDQGILVPFQPGEHHGFGTRASTSCARTAETPSWAPSPTSRRTSGPRLGGIAQSPPNFDRGNGQPRSACVLRDPNAKKIGSEYGGWSPAPATGAAAPPAPPAKAAPALKASSSRHCPRTSAVADGDVAPIILPEEEKLFLELQLLPARSQESSSGRGREPNMVPYPASRSGTRSAPLADERTRVETPGLWSFRGAGCDQRGERLLGSFRGLRSGATPVLSVLRGAYPSPESSGPRIWEWEPRYDVSPQFLPEEILRLLWMPTTRGRSDKAPRRQQVWTFTRLGWRSPVASATRWAASWKRRTSSSRTRRSRRRAWTTSRP